MNLNSTPSERVAIIGRIAPISSASAVNTGLVPIKDFFRLMAIINVGVIASTGTVNAKLQAAVGSGGTPVDIAGATITQLTQAGTDSNKIAIIDLNLDKLAGDAYTHVQLVITPAVAAALISAELIGFDSRSLPAYSLDGAFVDEIVTV
jgi:hypothetical protein